MKKLLLLVLCCILLFACLGCDAAEEEVYRFGVTTDAGDVVQFQTTKPVTKYTDPAAYIDLPYAEIASGNPQYQFNRETLDDRDGVYYTYVELFEGITEIEYDITYGWKLEIPEEDIIEFETNIEKIELCGFEAYDRSYTYWNTSSDYDGVVGYVKEILIPLSTKDDGTWKGWTYYAIIVLNCEHDSEENRALIDDLLSSDLKIFAAETKTPAPKPLPGEY